MVFVAAHAIDISQESGADPPTQHPNSGFAVTLDLKTSSADDLLSAIRKAQEKSAELKAAEGKQVEDNQEGLKVLGVKDLPSEMVPKVDKEKPQQAKLAVPLNIGKTEQEEKKSKEDKKAADKDSMLEELMKALPEL